MLTEAQKNVIKKLVKAHGNTEAANYAGDVATLAAPGQSGEDTCLRGADFDEVTTYAINLRLNRDPAREAARKHTYTKEASQSQPLNLQHPGDSVNARDGVLAAA